MYSLVLLERPNKNLVFRFQKSKSDEERKELTDKAEAHASAAANLKIPEKAEVTVREWLPYNDYQSPDAVDASELSWSVPTIQRLWFG